MDAGKQRESEDRRVDGWQIIPSTGAGLSGKHDYRDRKDLNQSADFTRQRRLERPEARHHIDCGRSHQNKDIAADDGNSHPKWDRQMIRNRNGVDAAHRKHNKRRYQHQFVGNRIEYSTQRGLLLETPGKKPVESVRDSGDDKNAERQKKSLIEKQRNENRDKRHAKDRQDVWQGDNPGGHGWIQLVGFRLRPGISNSVF